MPEPQVIEDVKDSVGCSHVLVQEKTILNSWNDPGSDDLQNQETQSQNEKDGKVGSV